MDRGHPARARRRSFFLLAAGVSSTVRAGGDEECLSEKAVDARRFIR